MRVAEIIKTKGAEVIVVDESVPIGKAVQIMRLRRIGALVVVAAGGEMKGVVSEHEIIVALADHGRAALDLSVRSLMLPGGPTVAPTDSVAEAMRIMTDQRVRHLPVMAGQSIVGLLSIGDAVKARLSEKVAENLVLQDIARWPVALVA